MFAKAYYKNRFTLSSGIVSKSFSPQDVESKSKGVITYSSRVAGGSTAFAPLRENLTKPYGIKTEEGACVEEKIAYNDILGVTCKDGLITYRIGADKYQPTEDSIFMFDVSANKECKLKVGLLSFSAGKVTEYFSLVKVVGGTWQNVKLSVKSFKTKEGVPIRDFGVIDALSFETENYDAENENRAEFYINNALWV